MTSVSVRQTPSLVRASDDDAFSLRSNTTSAITLSPNLRDISATVLPAVYQVQFISTSEFDYTRTIPLVVLIGLHISGILFG